MIHLVGLPHTPFDKVAASSCAFTAKAVRLTEMLRSTGREVRVLWGTDLGEQWQEEHFGKYDPNLLPVIDWNPALRYWREFHEYVEDEIAANIEPGDIVAIVGGSVSQEIVDAFKDQWVCVEPGVGYEGLCVGTHACFESYAWMHNRYGAFRINDGRFFDAVIPNAVDPADWSLADSDGYALFVGRLIRRKGPHVAAEIAKAAGLPLIMAGGGVAHAEKGLVIATDGTTITGDVEHIGSVGGEDRRWLYAHAEVFVCPTLYIEPWGGVHAEAMMSGIGVVAPDFGAFTETLPIGYRYRTLNQGVASVHAARATRGEVWRDRAIRTFGIERCTRMYDAWFDRLESLSDGRNGWYGA